MENNLNLDNQSVSPERSAAAGSRRFFAVVVTAIIFFGGLLLLFLFFKNILLGFYGRNISDTSKGDLFSDAAQDFTAEREVAEKADRPSLGNKDAKLVIVEFADFQCPYCRQEFPIIREVFSQYENDLLFIYRNYPVTDENSVVLAQAGYCAAEQKKFWEFHDRLFLNDAPTDLAGIKDLASTAGVDVDQLVACLNANRYNDKVVEDVNDALSFGAQGTPTFVINGQAITGALTKDQWIEIIEKAKSLLVN